MSRTPRMGTLAWAEQSARLSNTERMRLIADVAASQVTAGLERFAVRTGFRGAALGRVDLKSVPVVDSIEARAALEFATEIYDLRLLLHCQRSWYWSWMLGQYEGRRADPELVFVSCILHDLGLADRYSPAAADGDFSVVGAQAARTFLTERGWDPQRRDIVADAISLHLNPRVDARIHGDEARLLSLGPALDFFGFGAHRIPSATAREVLERHPRPESAKDLFPEIVHGDGCRPSFLLSLGIKRFVTDNPLDRIGDTVNESGSLLGSPGQDD